MSTQVQLVLIVTALATVQASCVGMRPSVLPTLSSLPLDREKREARYYTSSLKPEAEAKAKSPAVVKRIETLAAALAVLAAGLVGSELGATATFAIPFDEVSWLQGLFGFP